MKGKCLKILYAVLSIVAVSPLIYCAGEFDRNNPNDRESRGYPEVISVIPADGDTEVAVDAEIAIAFSEPMDLENDWSVTADNIVYDKNSGDISWEGEVLTIIPAEFFTRGTKVDVSLNNFRAVDKTDLTGSTVFSFSVDDILPEVKTISPEDSAVDVQIHSAIVITFSERMDTENNWSVTAAGTAYDKNSLRAVWDDCTLTIDPELVFVRSSVVNVVLSNFVTAVDSWPLTGTSSFSFTAKSDDFPTAYTIPADGASEVKVDSTVKIIFSELMNSNPGWKVTIGVTDYTSGTWVDNTLEITPATLFTRSAPVSIVLSGFTALNDNAGLTGITSFIFTAQGNPYISEVSPYHNDTGVGVDASIEITFSEEMNTGGWTVNVDSVDYHAADVVPAWDGNCTLVINPETFLRGSSIDVTFVGFTAEVDNAPMATPEWGGTLTFNVTDSPDPVVSSSKVEVNDALTSCTTGAAPALTGVDVDSNIVITFSEEMVDDNSWNVDIGGTSYSNTVNGTLKSWNGTANTVLTINPSGFFSRNQEVVISLTGFKAAYDNMALQGSDTFSFKVKDYPYVASFTPADQYKGVSVASDLVITFSEPMVPDNAWEVVASILTVGDVTYGPAIPLNGGFSWNTNHTVLTVYPASDFPTGKRVDVNFKKFQAAIDNKWMNNEGTNNQGYTQTFTTWWNVSIFIESWHIYGREIPSGADGGGGDAELYFAIRVSQEGGSDIIIACQGMNYYQTMVTGSDITNYWFRTGWWENPGTASDTMRDHLFTAVPRTTASGKVYIWPILMEYDESNDDDVIVWAYSGGGGSDVPLCIYWDVNSDTFKCYYYYATDAEMTVPTLTGAVTPTTWNIPLDGVGGYYTVSYCYPGQARINLQWRITATLVDPMP